MPDAAIIFDVDGVLLSLTAAEEDCFFEAFRRRYGLTGLSRDWNSYRTRNDEEIVAEILETHGLPATDQQAVLADYLAILSESLAPVEIPGARDLLASLASASLGIATANIREAARLRLAHLDLWQPLAAHAFGADGGGHKRETVARAIASVNLPKDRIIYIGDNLNDADAGLSNGVHFIGFSENPSRLPQLAKAGATHLSNSHQTTLKIIRDLLGGL